LKNEKNGEKYLYMGKTGQRGGGAIEDMVITLMLLQKYSK
jgi:hypothetical protein